MTKVRRQGGAALAPRNPDRVKPAMHTEPLSYR